MSLTWYSPGTSAITKDGSFEVCQLGWAATSAAQLSYSPPVLMNTLQFGSAVSIVVWLWPERALIQREPVTVHDAGG